MKPIFVGKLSKTTKFHSHILARDIQAVYRQNYIDEFLEKLF